MNKTITLLALLFSSFVSHAQDFWTETPIFSSSSYYVSDISIVDESTVWVLGTDYNDVSPPNPWRWGRSTDGGVTWTHGWLPDQATFPGASEQFMTNIVGLSGQTAYIGVAPNTVNETNRLLKTSDAGVTWTQIHSELFSDPLSFLTGVHFFDSDHGVAFGSPVDNYFEIYTTNDAGNTWTRTPSANIPSPLADEYMQMNNFDVAAGILRLMTNKGRLFSSPDQGLTWTADQTPDNSQWYRMYVIGHRYFAFKNASDGLLVSGDNPVLYRTSDGGATWNADLSVTGDLLNLGVANVPQTAGTYYNTGRVSDEDPWGSGYTTDTGNEWTAVDDNPDFAPILAEFFNPTVGYASGFKWSSPGMYGFYRLTDPLDRLLKKEIFIAEEPFSAAPNPTNNTVKLSGAAIYAVAVYDISGKLIWSEKYNGLDEASLDLSQLQAGAYFAKVSGGDGTSTVKIIKN